MILVAILFNINTSKKLEFLQENQADNIFQEDVDKT